MNEPTVWSVLSPALQPRTLTGLAVSEGFEGQFDSGHCLRVGIDASEWVYDAVKHYYPHPDPSGDPCEMDEPELLELFQRLCHLVDCAVTPIFAFEKPGSLCFSGGTRYTAPDEAQQSILHPFQQYIESFGFYWFTAVGEPKADLAQLSRQHLVDAVMTEDYEALAFGATTVVMYSRTPSEDPDQIDVYNAQDFLVNPEVKIGREGLFLMAVLSGGHADPIGLCGCEPDTALLVARTSVATSLFNAVILSSCDDDLCQFLPHWRNDLKTLLTHDYGHELEGRRFPNLAQNITDDFPSIDVIRRYVNPPAPCPETANGIRSFEFREPRLAEIALQTERHFHWGFHQSIIPKFRDLVWPGIILRYFLQVSLDIQPRLMHERPHRSNHPGWTRDLHNGLCAEQFRLLEAHAARNGPNANPEALGYVVELSTDHGIQNVMSHGLDVLDPGLYAAQVLSIPSPRSSPFACWIPEAIVNVAMPGLVDKFFNEPGY